MNNVEPSSSEKRKKKERSKEIDQHKSYLILVKLYLRVCFEDIGLDAEVNRYDSEEDDRKMDK